MKSFKQSAKKKQDNLIIRELPVDPSLPPSPRTVRGRIVDTLDVPILKAISTYLGKAPKGIENTVRWKRDEHTNEETWHSHPAHDLAIFYCLRADENAQTYYIGIRDILEQADSNMREQLTRDQRYLAEQEPFALIEHNRLSEHIYVPSDFQQHIQNLELPDVIKGLVQLREAAPEKLHEPITYLIQEITDSEERIVYRPGDLAIYNEHSTLRYSPPFISTKDEHEARWLRAISIKIQ